MRENSFTLVCAEISWLSKVITSSDRFTVFGPEEGVISTAAIDQRAPR